MTTWHNKRRLSCSKTSPSVVVRESAKITMRFIQKCKRFAKNVLYKLLKNSHLNLKSIQDLSGFRVQNSHLLSSQSRSMATLLWNGLPQTALQIMNLMPFGNKHFLVFGADGFAIDV